MSDVADVPKEEYLEVVPYVEDFAKGPKHKPICVGIVVPQEKIDTVVDEAFEACDDWRDEVVAGLFILYFAANSILKTYDDVIGSVILSRDRQMLLCNPYNWSLDFNGSVVGRIRAAMKKKWESL